MDSVGQRLKAWRKEKGLTTTEISAKTGLSTGGLSAYERDEKLIGSKSLLALWKEYNIDIAWILTGKRENELTTNEQKLVNLYRSTNEIGQPLILKHAEDMQKALPRSDQRPEQDESSTSLIG